VTDGLRDPTATTFHGLLSWLDEGHDSRGGRYVEIRRRLVGYFARKSCDLADALADETLNRVARRLAEEGSIAGVAPAQYCYIVARFVFHEHLRESNRRHAAVADLQARAAAQSDRADAVATEARLTCLDRCLDALDRDDRALILEYYQGEARERIERRRGLASRHALTGNALMIRASRLRTRLEQCVVECDAHDRQTAVLSQ
jgi:DNA-directed RNA polymerase specialized sigma24 family protein